MPELGEVEIARLNLEEWWVHSGTPATTEVHVLDPKILTTGSLEALLELLKQTPTKIGRRGKQLWAEFEDGHVLALHFRMTGQITHESQPDIRFARLAWPVGNGWLVFSDPRRFGHVDIYEDSQSFQKTLEKFGPEPADADSAMIAKRVGKRALKSALLDQAIIAGIGNIAYSEVMWRQKLHPDLCGEDLSARAWKALIQAFVEFFEEVVARDRDAARSGELTYVNMGGENPFDVYQREVCFRCGGPISRLVQGGRSTYFCPKCQKKPRKLNKDA